MRQARFSLDLLLGEQAAASDPDEPVQHTHREPKAEKAENRLSVKRPLGCN